MGSTVVQRSFAAGEIAPALAARADLVKYLTGLRTCRNFLVQRHGGVANRPGTGFIAAGKTTDETFLFPFIFSATDSSYVIEAGQGYFRFYRNGARVTVSGVGAYSGATAYVPGDLVVDAGVHYYCHTATTGNPPPNTSYWHALTGTIYEIPTPYSTANFKAPAPVGWSQAGLIVTITHLDHAPMELVYSSATRWVLRTITTGPSIAAPAAPGGIAGGAGARTFQYVITAASADTYEESLPSALVTIATAADPTAAAPHVLSWTLVSGAAEYYVYSDGGFGNGVYGYLGTAAAASFRDVGQVPDFGRTPPTARALFASPNDYPACAVTYQQRRIFAGTYNDREAVWASQVGFRSNFGISLPLQDDDAVTFSMASNLMQPVRHLVGLTSLVILTDQGEHVVKGDETGTLTPSAINPLQHAYSGSSYLPPVVIGNSIVYVQARGTVLRDLKFDQQVEGYQGRDLSLYSAHLFKGTTIVDLAYAQVPNSIVWLVRSDGVLLGLTYIREEDVWGWHRHDTDGAFEQVCVVPEGSEDAVYVVVRRSIGGSDVRYIERFRSRQYTALADAVHVDASITYTGAATTAITGLAHLNGQSVYALADGRVQGPFVVIAGAITLITAAATVHVGLPMTAELETLDLDVQGSSLRDKPKRVLALSLLLEDTVVGFSVGPDAAHLSVVRAAAWDDAAAWRSDQVEVSTTSAFTTHGRMLLRHTSPLPVTILGILPHLDVGG